MINKIIGIIWFITAMFLFFVDKTFVGLSCVLCSLVLSQLKFHEADFEKKIAEIKELLKEKKG